MYSLHGAMVGPTECGKRMCSAETSSGGSGSSSSGSGSGNGGSSGGGSARTTQYYHT